jgi:phosphatidylethanolamine N-methyltransferase
MSIETGYVDGIPFSFPKELPLRVFYLWKPHTVIELVSLLVMCIQLCLFSPQNGLFLWSIASMALKLHLVLLRYQGYRSWIRYKCKWIVDVMRRQLQLYVERNTEMDVELDEAPIEYSMFLIWRQLEQLCTFNHAAAVLSFGIQDSGILGLKSWTWNHYLSLGFFVLYLVARLRIATQISIHQQYHGFFFYHVDDYDLQPVWGNRYLIYSVGCAGYYILALCTLSKSILYIALSTHFFYFLFSFYEDTLLFHSNNQSYFNHDLVLVLGLDLYRVTDLLTLLIGAYTILVRFLLNPNEGFLIAQAILWKTGYVLLGCILVQQRKNRFWTRGVMRRGGTTMDAFANWKVIWNVVNTMAVVTFFLASLSFLNDWDAFSSLGLGMVLLGSWISLEEYRRKGPEGWFHGHYFLEPQRMNRVPSDWVGTITVGCCGAVLITKSWQVALMTLVSQLANIVFHKMVERPGTVGSPSKSHGSLLDSPHQALLSSDSEKEGVMFHLKYDSDTMYLSSDEESDTQPRLRRRRTQSIESLSVRETIKNVVQEVGELVDTAASKLAQKTRKSVVHLAHAARMEESLPRSELPLDLYQISCSKTPDEDGVVRFLLGEPIEIEFQGCRETMKRLDWIGIYEQGQNFDPLVTTTVCGTKWSYVAGHMRKDYDYPTFLKSKQGWHFGFTKVNITRSDEAGLRIVRGKVLFQNIQLPWRIGSYEMRYHYDGKYNVITTTQFEVMVQIPTTFLKNDISEFLYPMLILLLDSTHFSSENRILDHVTIPKNSHDSALDYQKQISKRIVYLIRIAYGVDFSWQAIDKINSFWDLVDRVSFD